jgi:acetylornithine/N-succinyldiaminopimelate aminotransferase
MASSADLVFGRGDGAFLYTADGREFLDFASGIAVTSLGHAHPHLVAALREQAGKLWHTSNLFRIAGQEQLAARLVAHSFADTVFFTNSGVEAVECGLKLVRKYHDETGHPERYRVITFEGAFHGRSLATISAGRQEKHVAGFAPLVDGFDQVPWGDAGAAARAIGSETAAILVEPVQGEGGIRVPPPGFLAALRGLADTHGLLLFIDEVQTGMGRSGRLFACEREGVVPDVMALAKALGGGFPIGACLATGQHHVERIAAVLEARLGELARHYQGVIEDVRGVGLLMGLKCLCPNTDLVAALYRHHMLSVAAADNVVRLLPPLIIDESHVDAALARLSAACAELAS